MYSVYIEISCPNFPLFDNLTVHIPELEDFNFYQFEFKEAVEIVSFTNSYKWEMEFWKNVWYGKIFFWMLYS